MALQHFYRECDLILDFDERLDERLWFSLPRDWPVDRTESGARAPAHGSLAVGDDGTVIEVVFYDVCQDSDTADQSVNSVGYFVGDGARRRIGVLGHVVHPLCANGRWHSVIVALPTTVGKSYYDEAQRIASPPMVRRVPVDQLVGAAEIAKRLGSAPRTVHDWRRRHPDFPAPVAELTSALVWAWPDVERWARKTGRLT